MAISHVKSNTAGDWTGTVTVGNSTGGTQTMNATDLVRPGDWNSAHNQFYTLTGNTTGNSTASGTNVMFAASGNIKIAGSTGTIVISDPILSAFNPYPNLLLVQATMGAGSLYFNPVDVQRAFQHDRMIAQVFYSQDTNSTATVTVSAYWGWYTKNVSTLSMLKTGSGTWSINGLPASSNENVGAKLVSFGSTDTISAGNYALAFMSRTTTAGANASLNNYVLSIQASSASGLMGVASAASNYRVPGVGRLSVSTAAMPASVAYSDIIGNSSTAQRPPAFYFTSGMV